MASRVETRGPARRALARSESLCRLRAAPYGRLLLSVDCLPAAHPVFLAVLADDVVALVGPGPDHKAAVRGDVVSLEVDGMSSDRHATWSVRVTGVARSLEVDDPLRGAVASSRLRSIVTDAAALLALSLDLILGETTHWTS